MSELNPGQMQLVKDFPAPVPDMEQEIDEISLSKAVAWVVNTFEAMIVYEADAPEEARIVEWLHTITKKEARQKWMLMPDGTRSSVGYPKGTTLRHWTSADGFARKYLCIILSEDIPYNPDKPEEGDKIDVIIAYDILHKIGRSRFLQPMRDQGLI